ncbi:MAG: hypothetical protein JZD41_02040 [Thermoproteus sp.]|nr:hypothetical protein [Thermoproteus sp.]
MASVILPRGLAERLRWEAERAGVSLDVYIFDVLSSSLDLIESGKAYAEASYFLLVRAEDELAKGDVKEAAEKAWGAAALAVKAYAALKEEKKLENVVELWEYVRALSRGLGEWIFDAWAHANAMLACSRDGLCTAEHVEVALKRIRALVDEIKKRL